MPDTEPQLPSVARAPISFVLLPGTGSGTDSPDVVAAWTAVLDGLDRDWELLLPERDGSRSLADGQPRIRVLRQTADAGAGGVLRAALAVARFPLLCHAPWDRQYQPADVKRLLDHIDPVHLASGIRKGQPMPTALRVAGWLYRGFVRVLFGVPLEPLPGWLGWGHRREHLLYRLLFGIRNPDATCPFRLIRKEIFARIPLQSDGPFVHVELLAKGRFLGGYYMDEVPVAWQPPATPESFAPKAAGPAPRLASAGVPSCEAWLASVRAKPRPDVPPELGLPGERGRCHATATPLATKGAIHAAWCTGAARPRPGPTLLPG